MCDVAAGIDHLHAIHVLHRDIKSDNVLVKSLDVGGASDDGDATGASVRVNACLADFGLSRATQGNLNTRGAMMTAGLFLGTPYYRDPTISKTVPARRPVSFRVAVNAAMLFPCPLAR